MSNSQAQFQNPLKKELIIEKCKKQNFNEIKNINLWGTNLDDIQLISQLVNLEVVSLSVNQISTLKDFVGCPRIQELYLRKNNIADLNEIYHLQNHKQLKVLWLSDNPCANDNIYRSFVIKTLPQLVKLDSQEISDDERKKAYQMNFDQLIGQGISKNPSNRNILQQNLMSQNNAQMRKSPFKSNENLVPANQGVSKGQISSSKLESLRSQENSGYTPQLKRVQNIQQNRSNSSSAHAPRPGQQQFSSNQNSIHNQSVTSNSGQNSQNHNNSMQNQNAHRNENILCAVLALIKELNESELELIKRDIDKKLQISKKSH